jgi:hypothetical protein
MKKIILLLGILIVISSCSTYYGKYDYNQYFQNNEPFVTVDSEEEAASFIARKLARGFRRSTPQTIAILNFTDEYGDRLNRGVFFADMVMSGLSYYRNPVVVERNALYEIVKERELSQTNLIANKGTELSSLIQADLILTGRILRGRHEDMISVRCFRVGTGEVVYASTISIDYTPDPVVVPVPTPPHVIVVDPGRTTPPTQDPVVIIDNSDNDNNGNNDPVEKPKPKPSTGTENKGKIDLNNTKKIENDQYQYKETPTVTPPEVKKPSVVKEIPQDINKTVLVKKTVPVVKKSKKVEEVVVEKDPLVEEKEVPKKEESKTTTSTVKKKASTISTIKK